jgi:hypothetical protein
VVADLNVRHLFGLVLSCGGRRRSPMVLVDHVEDVCVIGLVCRVLLKKRICAVPPDDI